MRGIQTLANVPLKENSTYDPSSKEFTFNQTKFVPPVMPLQDELLQANNHFESAHGIFASMHSSYMVEFGKATRDRTKLKFITVYCAYAAYLSAFVSTRKRLVDNLGSDYKKLDDALSLDLAGAADRGLVEAMEKIKNYALSLRGEMQDVQYRCEMHTKEFQARLEAAQSKSSKTFDTYTQVRTKNNEAYTELQNAERTHKRTNDALRRALSEYENERDRVDEAMKNYEGRLKSLASKLGDKTSRHNDSAEAYKSALIKAQQLQEKLQTAQSEAEIARNELSEVRQHFPDHEGEGEGVKTN